MRIISRINKKIMKHVEGVYKYLTLKVLYPREYQKYVNQPVDERKIIFVEMRYAYLSDSFHLLYNSIKQNYDVEIHTHFPRAKGTTRSQRISRGKLLMRDIATAKYVFVSDGSNFIGSVTIRPETKIIQLWHACGAFKRFGKSTADFIFGGNLKQQDAYPSHKNYSLVPVSSPEVIWAYEEAMDLEKGVAKALGTSRTDIFYDDELINRAKKKLQEFMPESVGKKVILYAPTFRGRAAKAKTSWELDVPIFKENLSDEYVLLIKHHPLVKKLPEIAQEDESFARDVTQDFNIEELLCVADICISDYSSIIYEYSLFERPMIFFAYDIDDFEDWRGFYYDYNELTPGPIFKTNAEIIDYIEHIDEKFDKKEVAAFRKKFMSACDGQATAKIMNEVFGENLEKYKRKQPLLKEEYNLPTSETAY